MRSRRSATSDRTGDIWTRPFVLAVVATTVTFVGFFFLLPVLPAWAIELGADKEEAGLVVAVYTISAAVVRVAFATTIDRSGPRRPLILGLAVFALAAAGSALATTFPALLAWRLVHGAGWGIATTAFASLVAGLAPPARRGEAIAWWGMAPTIALAASPPVGGALAAAAGMPVLFACVAALGAVAAILVVAIPTSAVLGVAHAPATFRPPRTALAPSAGLFLSSLGYGALTAYLPVELADRPGLAGTFFAVFGGAILVSRPFAGRSSDRWGRLTLIVPGLAVGALGTVLVGWPHLPLALFSAAVLVGVGIGGAAFPALLTLTVDRAPDSGRAASIATFQTAYDCAIGLGAGALGTVYARWGFPAMNVVGAVGIVAAIPLLLATRPGRR